MSNVPTPPPPAADDRPRRVLKRVRPGAAAGRARRQGPVENVIDLSGVLGPTQLAAATTVDAPVCILAGAGTGKTRTITHRIAHLIANCGYFASTIMAVTFTNKAAREMRERIESLVPGEAHRVRVGTFHGTAARVLRRHGPAVGLPRSFVIYDQDDAQRLMKSIIVDEFNWVKDLVKPVASQIDDWQNEGKGPGDVSIPRWDPVATKGIEVYKRYIERLAALGATDFGGLLLKWRELLQHEGIGPVARQEVRHLLVDEYQDTNPVQADIVFAYGREADSVAVVGDDDQAIYGWRGASADNLKTFLQKMPGAKLFKLEDNHRSTGQILKAANTIIRHNKDRLGKELRAVHDEGGPLRIARCRNDVSEAQLAVQLIEEHVGRGVPSNEVAILFRTNAQSRPFEEAFGRAGVSYRLVGGVRFYDRKEVKDALATLRAALNPKSDVDTVRALGAIPRGIGQKSLAKLEQGARDKGCSLLRFMADDKAMADAGLPKRLSTKAHAFGKKLVELGERALPPDGYAAALERMLAAEAGELPAQSVAQAVPPHGTPDGRQAAPALPAVAGGPGQTAEERGEAAAAPAAAAATQGDLFSMLAAPAPAPAIAADGATGSGVAVSDEAGAALTEADAPEALDGVALDAVDDAPRTTDDDVMGADRAVALAIEASGLADRLEAEGTEEAQGRLENLEQLRSAAAQFAAEARAAGTPHDALAFLENAALLGSPADHQDDDLVDPVSLMSMHAAKGLEFELVLIVGMEEHGFPHSRALADDADPSELEEERRLAYVGITRAKRHLVLTYADRRMVRGEPKSRRPSRFLRELPRDVVRGDIPGAPRGRGSHAGQSTRGPALGWSDDAGLGDIPRRNMRARRPARTTLSGGSLMDNPALAAVARRLGKTGAAPAEPGAPDEPRVELDPGMAQAGHASAPTAAGGFSEGSRVWHDHFGHGTIINLRGGGRLSRAIVRFDNDAQPRVIITRHLSPPKPGAEDEIVVVPFDD